ncbi:hypothetical protein ASE21_05095 [Flavobacterium sp. Root901]|uniref:SMI1/KNR4 family protein n=1 Tax=Flavobacterium sp. Root901 TaxID=1736605 RepID=UPI000709E4C4|nr:SMI1/KNR4 family protein [Flavobacterium sp. Root901]KRD11093.1 hypothetical protein ASE21_05095 [Flavobacterium sp. Root901]
MSILEKWDSIVNWQINNPSIDENKDRKEIIWELNKPITAEEIRNIEELSGEILPDHFKTLYTKANGQLSDSFPLFFGDAFMSSDSIVKDLEFARSLIKPQPQRVTDPEVSGALMHKIVAICVNDIPRDKYWFKVKFSCSGNSISGPALYENENTTSGEKEFFKISDLNSFLDVVRELHELEYESYNWDKIEFTLYNTGIFEWERKNYNFDEDIDFTSTPENAIKKKYFNHKWIPVFSDHGGNYIGMDLDPDVNGKRGQIINFGRDEEDMYVMADDLEQFFDSILNQLNINKGEALREFHIHDAIRELIKEGKF